MVVWLKPCESRSLPGALYKTPDLTVWGFLLAAKKQLRTRCASTHRVSEVTAQQERREQRSLLARHSSASWNPVPVPGGRHLKPHIPLRPTTTPVADATNTRRCGRRG